VHSLASCDWLNYIYKERKCLNLCQIKYIKTFVKQVAAIGFVLLIILQGVGCKSVTRKHKIMCLGDSITESEKRENSWRYMLVQKLYEEGYKGTFDMVGRNSGFRNNPDTDWDSEHCGYYSARADQLLNGGLPRGRQDHGCIKDWAPKYKPDIALIHLGTNDSRAGQSPESTLKDIGDIIGHLRSAVPDVKIVVAQIIPIGVESAEEVGRDLNSKIPAWAESISTVQSPVVVVDMHADMEVGRDLGKYHPFGDGSKKMAYKWYAAIKPWLDQYRH
jgi:lysophospholipase L1-like esterase